MKHIIRWMALLVCAATALPAPAQELDGTPDTYEAKNLRVTVDTVWARPMPGHSYPVRVSVENLGSACDVELRVESQTFGQGTSHYVRRRSRIDEAERADLSVLVPSGSAYASWKLLVDGNEIDEFHGSIGSGASPSTSRLVIDARRAEAGAISIAFAQPASAKGRYGSSDVCTILEPARLSDQWQAYAGLTGLYIHARDWNTLPRNVQRAILQALKAGQTIVFYGETQGKLEVDAGFGAIHWVNDDPAEADAGTWPTVTPTRKVKDFAYSIPVLTIPGVGEIPYSTFFWLVLLFAIIIGPLNAFVVHRMKRRLLFLVTTPAIAAVSVALLFGYAVIRDGFDIKGTTRSVTLLSGAEGEAVVVTRSAYYSGLGTGTWRYDPGTLCFPTRAKQDEDDAYGISRHYRRRPSAGGGSISIDLSDGQALSGSWVPARTVSNITTLQVTPSRARLQIEPAGDGTIRVLNGLGTRILRGFIRRGNVLLPIPALADGDGTTLQALSQSTKIQETPLLPPYDDKTFYTLANGEFIVWVETNPWQDVGHKTITSFGDVHLVKGRVSETP